ncbi:MAG: ATP-dependent zinc metalloprotease FtsH [Phycisphaeraceae bacterium]|nr:ATP-dependent zinc metalloprotease FtsH [Phycisphaeraceae bacterium]
MPADQTPHDDSDRPDGQNRRGRGIGPGRNGQNPMSRNLMGLLLLAVLAIVVFGLLGTPRGPQQVSWGEFLNLAKAKAFDGPVTIEDARFVATIKEGWEGREQKPAGTDVVYTPFPRESLAYYLTKLDGVVDTKANPSSGLLLQLLVSWGPLLLVLGLIWFFLYRSLRNAGGGAGMLGNFGRSRHRMMTKEHSKITFEDVAGIDEAKEEISEIVEFLKNPKKFQRLGGRVPRGVLLVGDPGVGKTLLAKAVAGEADVPFFSISGSDFVEMFVGVGASRVRDLFKQAKDNSPCIIFLDEIDAVGRRRGSGFSSGGHDEREQTLNAILVEMDGFESSDQVIVMAATNRSDVLDPALTRPGRFDRQISVPLPDLAGRMEILRVHSKKIKMSPHTDLERLARGTPMFSGADLAAIINEAAIAATLAGKEHVEQADLEEARDKVKWGRARTSHKIDEDEKRVIAYHEAGHALVMLQDGNSEPLHKVTIIPRGTALGVTFMLPEKDRHIHQRKRLLSQLRVTFGGRIAEEMFCGDISSGAAMDIRQATNIARAMVTQFGMSEKLGFQLLGTDESRNPWEQPERSYSDETAAMIDQEVKRLIDQTYQETRVLLETHRQQLDDLAQALLRYETLNRDEVDRIMKGQQLNKPTVGDLLRAEQDKANKGRTVQPKNTRLDGDAPSGNVMPTPA